MHYKQVKWETMYLEMVDVVLFWFCKETLCPMTLYEFSWMLNSNKSICVGADPEYQRFNDIKFRLEKINIGLATSLEGLVIG